MKRTNSGFHHEFCYMSKIQKHSGKVGLRGLNSENRLVSVIHLGEHSANDQQEKDRAGQGRTRLICRSGLSNKAAGGQDQRRVELLRLWDDVYCADAVADFGDVGGLTSLCWLVDDYCKSGLAPLWLGQSSKWLSMYA